MRYFKFRSNGFCSMLVVLLVTTACNKQGAGCFDKTGDTKTVLIEVSEFISIDVNSNVDVQLLTSGTIFWKLQQVKY